MIFGVICGFAAALCNSAGYLFSAGFLNRYRDPIRLLVMAQLVMMLVCLPFLFWLFPFAAMKSPGVFWLRTFLNSALFMLGQGAFFAALRHFEASRISSLLGLKIIVLSVIFLLSGGRLNALQLTAVPLASLAAVMFNWSGGGRSSLKGWALLTVTLVCYSLVDMQETALVMQVHEEAGFSRMRSALAVVPALYTMLGLWSVPALFHWRPDRKQLACIAPYSLLWLVSQILLLNCFAQVKPVFGNVILAMRGIFSVVIGAMLPLFGLAALDSDIPLSRWIQRVLAALLMLGAITLYSFGSL